MADRRGACVETLALLVEPGIELRAAVDGEIFEQGAGAKRRERAEIVGREAVEIRDETQHVDVAAVEIEGDAVLRRVDAVAAGGVQDLAQLGEAPAQLAARVVGDVPEQVAN